jgi:uncharacterized metal-binding protein
MAGQCCGGNGGETLIFTCAGAAYSGQVSNRAGVNLMQDGVGNLFCAAAVAAEILEKLERARNAGKRVVIDGCEDHCARKILEKAGLPVDLHLDVSTIGIPKKPEKPEMINDAKRVTDAVRAQGGCCA